MLESNYLAVLTQPTYEKPIRTLDDFLASSKKVFLYPEGSMFIEFYASFDDPKFTEMAGRMYVSKDDEHYIELSKGIHTKNNDVLMSPWLDPENIDFGFWYRSLAVP